MRDKWLFSNGQDLGSLDSTGVVSEHVFDMEQVSATDTSEIVTDDYVEAWFCFSILTCTQTSGDEGIDVELRECDNADMTTGTPRYLGVIKLIEAELVAGNKFAIKVSKAMTQRYLGAWYKAINSSLNLATTIDCWIHTGPLTENDAIQKIPSRS